MQIFGGPGNGEWGSCVISVMHSRGFKSRNSSYFCSAITRISNDGSCKCYQTNFRKCKPPSRHTFP